MTKRELEVSPSHVAEDSGIQSVLGAAVTAWAIARRAENRALELTLLIDVGSHTFERVEEAVGELFFAPGEVNSQFQNRIVSVSVLVPGVLVSRGFTSVVEIADRGLTNRDVAAG